MLVRGEREGVWKEIEFLCVVEAEEEVADGLCRVVDYFYGLGAVSAELHYFRFNTDDVRSHSLSVKI